MIELRIGENRNSVSTLKIDSVSINYAIKDIKNYGKRNASYTKPITVLRTKESDIIFKSLFDINIVNGYDITKQVYGELVEDDVVILRGNVKVENITANYYNIVLSTNNINLFDILGDDLIKGNLDASLDVNFTGELYVHNYDVSTIRNYMRHDPSNNGKGIMYAYIDHTDTIDDPTDLINNYPVIPCIAAWQLFDKIIKDANYSYSLSDDISTAISKMYIPWNNMEAYYNNYDYAKIMFGDPDHLTFVPHIGVLHEYYKINESNYLLGEPATYIGHTIDKGIIHLFYLDIDTTSTFNTLSGLHNYTDGFTSYKVMVDGIYDISIGLLLMDCEEGTKYNAKLLINKGISQISDNNESIDIIDTTFPTFQASYYVNKSLNNLELKSNYELSIVRYQTSTGPVPSARLKYDASTFMSLTLKGTPWGMNSSINLNTILPINYKKSDFINDIFKTFNAYIEVDEFDEHKLLIKSYDDFYNNSVTKDWTSKVIEDTTQFSSIKNDTASFRLSYTPEDDIYNKDFNSKSKLSFGSLEVINDSEYSKDFNEIKLSTPPTIMKTIGFDVNGPATPPPPPIMKTIQKV